jgi:L-2-hydroxycarboxylate dehydrogenase (NAD+)
MQVMMAQVETKTFSVQALREFTTRTFLHFGVSQQDAAEAADVLLCADLRGIDSHGVARLHSYFELLQEGRINPRPQVKVIRSTASTATVDGDNGLGLVVGPLANRMAIDLAEKSGTGWVSVCNTNHFGIAGYYVLKALERDLIGWAMTNSTKLVAPVWGAEPMLGTNPIAIAFPAKDEPPIVIDMATSAVALGKVEMALRKGTSIPLGWGMDRGGRGTTDPEDIVKGGMLLPLGSDRERGAHKGYCLGVMVDVLSAVLSGANWGPFTVPFVLRNQIPSRSVGKGIGHFFGAMRINAFIDADEFKSQMDEYVRVFRATRPEPGTSGPLLPGDPEREAEQVRREQGIPLLPAVMKDLLDVSEKIGVPLGEPN